MQCQNQNLDTLFKCISGRCTIFFYARIYDIAVLFLA